MSQEIKAVGALSPQGNANVIDNEEDKAKSWWESVVGFIFADEEGAKEPVAVLEDKKITEIDPKVLRKKSQAEAKTEAAKPNAPKAEAAKPNAPKAEATKPNAPKAEATKPNAPKAEAAKPNAPKTEAAVKNIAVNQKMRKAAELPLKRLSTRMDTVLKRIAVFEDSFVKSQQQIKALDKEISDVNKNYLDKKKRRPKAMHKLASLQERVAELKERLTLVEKSDAEAHRGHAVAQKELVLVKKAISQAEKVVSFLENSEVNPERLKQLQNEAAVAERGLAALKA